MQTIRREFERASSEVRVETWGAVFRASGVVTGTDVDQLLGAVKADLAATRAAAAVCDYSRADMRVDAERIMLAHRVGPKDQGWVTALVVHPDHVGLWRQYAWLQGMQGNLRGVFLRHEDAARWAIQQAALREIHIRWLARAR